MKKVSWIVVIAGAVVGLAAVVLTHLGNPANMGFCIACFLRDITGAVGMHGAAKVQYVRPEIIGLVLGAFIMSVATKEFRAKAGSSPATRFVLGAFVMIGALAFLGCPLRMVLRIGGGDLNAVVGLVGFTLGIFIGIQFLKRGFSLKRAYPVGKGEGASAALGFGFRCGFLGLLHMEIITERLEREFDLDIITTTPSVRYRLTMTDGTVEMIDNPSSYPDPSNIVKQEEPFVDVHLYTPNDYVGALMDLCQQKRGVLIDMKYLDDVRVDLHYALPLGEIVYDFFDAIKSRSRGYASYDYEFKEYRESDLVKLDFLLNGDPVDALSMIVFRDNAYAKGRRICEKLRDNIPRTLFEIPVQAAIGGKIIARETVKAMRKDVLAKCYGGDISRKKKLLEKQKEGKKKMRQLGSVSLPSEAFTAVLKLDSTDD